MKVYVRWVGPSLAQRPTEPSGDFDCGYPSYLKPGREESMGTV